MSEPVPPNDVDLLRLVWCPDDMENGKLIPTAFPKNDLKTMERRLSVDRTDWLNPEAVRQLEEQQRTKADPDRNIYREQSYAAFLKTGDIRLLEHPEGQHPLCVNEDRIPGNDAHCSIGNHSGQKSRAFILKLQTMLIEAVRSLEPLEAALDARR